LSDSVPSARDAAAPPLVDASTAPPAAAVVRAPSTASSSRVHGPSTGSCDSDPANRPAAGERGHRDPCTVRRRRTERTARRESSQLFIAIEKLQQGLRSLRRQGLRHHVHLPPPCGSSLAPQRTSRSVPCGLRHFFACRRQRPSDSMPLFPCVLCGLSAAQGHQMQEPN